MKRIMSILITICMITAMFVLSASADALDSNVSGGEITEDILSDENVLIDEDIQTGTGSAEEEAVIDETSGGADNETFSDVLAEEVKINEVNTNVLSARTDEGNLTTEDITNYSIGTLKGIKILKAGSYIGYAVEDDMGYGGLDDVPKSASASSDGNIAYNSTVMTVNAAGNIVLTKGSAQVDTEAFIPSVDKNGIERPIEQPVFAETKFSMSKAVSGYTYIVQMCGSSNAQTSFQFGRLGNGGASATVTGSAGAVAIEHRASTGGDVYGGVSGLFSANNVVSMRSLHEFGGGEGTTNRVWVWGWNPNASNANVRSRTVVPQLSGYAAYGRTDTYFNKVLFRLHGNLASGDTMTIHSVRVCEQYEMLFRDAVSEAEKDMLGSNSDLSNVMSDLTLCSSVTGLGGITDDINADNRAVISWESSDTGVINIDGTTAEVIRQTGRNAKVNLTGTFSIGGKTKTIVYEVRVLAVPGTVQPQDVVDSAWDNFVWSNLTEQNKNRVRQSFVLPDTVTSEFGEEVELSWEVIGGSPNLSLSSDGYTAEIICGDENASAILQATLAYNGETRTKDFTFTIWHKLIEFIYADENYTSKGNKTFKDGETDDDNKVFAKVASSNSSLKYTDKGLEAYGKNIQTPAAVNTAIGVVDIAALADKNKLLNEFTNFESDIVYEFTATHKIESLTTSEAHLYLMDSDGDYGNAGGCNLFAFLQFTQSTSGQGTINIKLNNGWLNGTDLNNGFISRYRAGYNGSDKCYPAVNFKLIYNRFSGSFKMYVKLAGGTDEYVVFCDTALSAYTNSTGAFSKGTHISKLEINSATSAASDRDATIILRDLRVYTDEDIILDYILNKVNVVNILNGQKQNSVTNDLNFDISPHYGTELTMDVESDYNGELFDKNGKLLIDLKGKDGEVYNVTIKPKIIFTNPKLINVIFPETEYALMVKGYNVNSLGYGKTVTLTGAVLGASSNLSYLTDGISGTSLETSGSEAAFSVTIDLSKNILFSKIVVEEEALNNKYNIKNWSIEVSTNRKTWNTFTEGNGIGEQKTINISSPYNEYRYVRLNIKDKITPADKVAIAEMQIFFEPDEAYRNLKDFENIQAPPSGASGDFYLQGVGSVYGSELVWISGNENILKISDARISDVSSVNYNKYKVTYTKPSGSSFVTLRVSVGSNSTVYTVSAGNSTSGGLGGGGGSGGGGNSGGSIAGTGGGGTVAYTPQPLNSDDLQSNQQDRSSKYFADLSEAPWAAEYVDALHEKGVVSGDDAGNFRPNYSVTREEYIKMLVLALEIELVHDTELPFVDVSKGNWAYPYIAGAYINGIVNGVSENMFGAGSEILRQDMSVMTLRALDTVDKVIISKVNNIAFKDEMEIDGYAAESVETMKKYGIFSGDAEGRFNPKNTATRAESAKVLYSIITN